MSLRKLSSGCYVVCEEEELSKLVRDSYRWYSPKFSPRNVPQFAEIGSITETPAALQAIRNFFVDRYRSMSPAPTHIAGFDARGFLFGPLIAVELKIPFVLLRKAEKCAGVLIKSEPYSKEYNEVQPEVLAIRQSSIPPCSRVVLIDDVLATGGTALSGLQLVEACNSVVLEVGTVLNLSFFKAAEKIRASAGGRYKHVNFVSIVTEKALSPKNCGDVPGYSGPRTIAYKDALSKL